MTQHLNTCFKRFTHFVLRCELLEPEDMAPLQGLVRAQWPQLARSEDGSSSVLVALEDI